MAQEIGGGSGGGNFGGSGGTGGTSTRNRWRTRFTRIWTWWWKHIRFKRINRTRYKTECNPVIPAGDMTLVVVEYTPHLLLKMLSKVIVKE